MTSKSQAHNDRRWFEGKGSINTISSRVGAALKNKESVEPTLDFEQRGPLCHEVGRVKGSGFCSKKPGFGLTKQRVGNPSGFDWSFDSEKRFHMGDWQGMGKGGGFYKAAHPGICRRIE